MFGSQIDSSYGNGLVKKVYPTLKVMESMMEDDKLFEESLRKTFVEALEKKKPLEEYSDREISDTYEKVLSASLPEFAEILLGNIKSIAPITLKRYREVNGKFKEHLWKEWGPAFDLLEVFLESCAEVGNEFSKKASFENSEDDRYLLSALTGLHARGCQVAYEVLALLTNGYPDGADARWRTLHEINVTAKFIAEHGNDTAERYFYHDIAESYKGLDAYKKYCKILGCEPFSEKELADMKAAMDKICNRFGKDFKEDYGWASEILGKNLSFKAIEEATKLDHMRGYYRMASHNVHAGSKGLFFKLGMPREFRGKHVLSVESAIGFTDPAHGTAISLYQLTSTLLLSKQGPSIYESVSLKALEMLVTEIGDIFLEIDNHLQNKNSHQKT
jgi:hypothetical protein